MFHCHVWWNQRVNLWVPTSNMIGRCWAHISTLSSWRATGEMLMFAHHQKSMDGYEHIWAVWILNDRRNAWHVSKMFEQHHLKYHDPFRRDVRPILHVIDHFIVNPSFCVEHSPFQMRLKLSSLSMLKMICQGLFESRNTFVSHNCILAVYSPPSCNQTYPVIIKLW